MIEHRDQLNQSIQVGQPVAFVSAYSHQMRLGTVVKLCPRRVKINFIYTYRSATDNTERTHSIDYLARPERCLALTETLTQELTVLKLRGLLP